MLKQVLEKFGNEIDTYLMTSEGIGIVLFDSGLKILGCNLGFMRLYNSRQNPAGEQLSDYFDIGVNTIRCNEQLKISCSRKSGVSAVNNCSIIQVDDEYLLFCERQMLAESRALEQLGKMNDDLINMQREVVKKNRVLVRLQGELDKHVTDLEATLARVRQLEGVIPICSYCKKIRDDQNSWHQLEAYISEHSEALFSHGICPACVEEQMKLIDNMPRSQ